MVIKVSISLIAVVFLFIALSLFIVWLQGLPGPHHGAYSAYASLWNIRTGLWSYEHLHDHLPPATSTNPQSGTLSSWRSKVYQCFVRDGLITKTEKHKDVSIDYDSEKTWNDPENLQLEGIGDRYFRYTPDNGHTEMWLNGDRSTYYKAITGTGTAFDSGVTQNLKQLPNDLILVVRVEKSSTHWMEPGDLNVEQLDSSKETKHLLSGQNGYAVLFADGKPWILSNKLPVSELRKFFTIDDAEQYDRDKILAPYKIIP